MKTSNSSHEPLCPKINKPSCNWSLWRRTPRHASLYMADLADIAAQYNLILLAFADDNQLYIHCKPENVQSAVTSVQQCVTAIEQ